MASVTEFGELKFKTITPDEIARTAYFTIKFGLTTDNRVEGERCRLAARAVLPIMGIEQLAFLLTAFDTPTLEPGWADLLDDIESLLS